MINEGTYIGSVNRDYTFTEPINIDLNTYQTISSTWIMNNGSTVHFGIDPIKGFVKQKEKVKIKIGDLLDE